MVSRRSHRKSRLGCKRCKARRIKCDEIRPICGGCLGRDISCDFSASNTTLTAQSVGRVMISRQAKDYRPTDVACRATCSVADDQSASLSPTTSVSNSYRPIPASVSTPNDSLLQLRLFHHYTKFTFGLFVSTLEQEGRTAHQRGWYTWITDLAVSTPSLMDAILGFSAFHLRYLDPFDQTVSEASHKYMARAITLHARQLHDGVDGNNAQALFATSIFVAFNAIVSQRFFDGNKAGASLPLHWFRSYQGIKAVWEAGWPWIQNTDVKRLVQLPIQRDDLLPRGGGRQFDFLLNGLDSEPGLDAATLDAYESSVAYLSRVCFSAVPRDLFRFPANVSPRFVELLEGEDPRILTIVGYFFMLLKTNVQTWYVQGTVEREFNAIMAFLPKEWWPRMDLAIRRFEWSETRAEC